MNFFVGKITKPCQHFMANTFMTQTDFISTEFLNKCAEVYQVMLQNRSSGMETVVVPTSQQRLHSVVSAAHGTDGQSTVLASGSSDGVDSSLFQRTLVVIADKMDVASVSQHYTEL